jgi:hypothetical protein
MYLSWVLLLLISPASHTIEFLPCQSALNATLLAEVQCKCQDFSVHWRGKYKNPWIRHIFLTYEKKITPHKHVFWTCAMYCGYLKRIFIHTHGLHVRTYIPCLYNFNSRYCAPLSLNRLNGTIHPWTITLVRMFNLGIPESLHFAGLKFTKFLSPWIQFIWNLFPQTTWYQGYTAWAFTATLVRDLPKPHFYFEKNSY